MSGSSQEAPPLGPSGGNSAAPDAAAVAEDFKDKGNIEYRAGRFLKAAALYTQGLKADPTNAVLYSNRSAALLALAKTTKAVADAEECIRLRPDWDKGYFRKAAALEALDQMPEALHSYQAALERKRDSKQLAEKVRLLQKIVSKQQQQAAVAAAAARSEPLSAAEGSVKR
ncbi:hypothetical protein ABPG77_002696 [Micractinium sp. CCAP 211/92]